MKNCSSIKASLLIGTIILLISSTIAPMVIGYNVRLSDNNMLAESYKFDRYILPEFYDCYNIDEIPDSEKYINRKQSDYGNIHSDILINPDSLLQTLDGPPMDSAWPMHGHDIFHTGRSPYTTMDNLGFEKWRFDAKDEIDGSAVIDENGTIYFGSSNGNFYALYPNGTQKWKTVLSHSICVFGTSPAIDENGVIYVPTMHGGLYAVNPDGTIKWKYGDEDIETSPVIGDDGTIYFCVESSGCVKALYPNGTLRWQYTTGHVVQSSPAIGPDGTVFCGSHDSYLYAFHPNNGTVKWKFKTGGWVHGSPSIGADGTVYIGSDDGNLYSLYPNNGTMKWKCSVGGMRCSPSIDKNGIIYFGVWQEKFFAVYPNGTVKWIFYLGKYNGMWGSTAAISDDGTIYFGICIDIEYLGGGDLIALNPDGTEKWRLRIAHDYISSSPSISKDGTVYIGSVNDEYHPDSWGYLHAIGEIDPNAPSAPEIDGPKKIKPDVEYEYKFNATSPLGNDVYYWIEWGDNKGTGWLGPYNSGEQITVSHKWPMEETFTIKVRAKDTDNLWGPWGEFEIEVTTSAPNAPIINGPTNGKVGVTYTYWAVTTDPENDKLSYFFDWGDGTTSGWTTPYVPSGTNVSASHKWKQGTFNIKVKAKDESGHESDWSNSLSITIPRNKVLYNSLFLRFLERFPMLERLLFHL